MVDGGWWWMNDGWSSLSDFSFFKSNFFKASNYWRNHGMIHKNSYGDFLSHRGTPVHHSFLVRVFHEINHPLLGTSISGNLHMNPEWSTASIVFLGYLQVRRLAVAITSETSKDRMSMWPGFWFTFLLGNISYQAKYGYVSWNSWFSLPSINMYQTIYPTAIKHGLAFENPAFASMIFPYVRLETSIQFGGFAIAEGTA